MMPWVKSEWRSSFSSLQSGKTPLHTAAWRGHTGAVTVLLERGAALDAKNNVSIYFLYCGWREHIYIYIYIYIYIMWITLINCVFDRLCDSALIRTIKVRKTAFDIARNDEIRNLIRPFLELRDLTYLRLAKKRKEVDTLADSASALLQADDVTDLLGELLVTNYKAKRIIYNANLRRDNEGGGTVSMGWAYTCFTVRGKTKLDLLKSENVHLNKN